MRKEFGFSTAFDIECFLSAFEANYSPGFYFKGEYHDFWEVVYVISNRLGVSADERIFELNEGDVIFHKPMEFHSVWTLGSSNAHLFTMSFRLSGELAQKLRDRVIHLSGHQRELMHDLISEFAENAGDKFEENPPADYLENNKVNNYLETWETDNASKLSIKYKALLLLIDILKSDFAQKEAKHSKSAEVYKAAIRFMEDNVCESISVSDIAGSCNFSEAYIKKVFARYSDCGIHKYFLKLKIKKALALLEGGMSVSETSDMLSFANANYFGICFKREMGCSPMHYMKNNMKNKK